MADEAAQLELKKRRTFRYYTHTIVLQNKNVPMILLKLRVTIYH